MPDRKSFVLMLLPITSLLLLASVLVAPGETLGFASISSRADSFRRTFALSPGQSTTRLTAAIPTDDVLQVTALASENEEQDRADALDESQDSFLIPCSFRKVSDRQLIAPRSILSLYPLRC